MTVPLRRNRDFNLYWGSQVVSTLGSRISSVAYPLLVLATTGSPAQAGLVGFAQTLPFIVFFLPAGATVDRADRKRIMLIGDAIRAAVMVSIVTAIVTDRLTLGHLAAAAFVEGTCFVYFELSESAALPHLVPPSQLPTAVARNQARVQGADLAGQPLGGVLFGLGRAVPFVVDACTYAVSFVAILFIRPRFQAVERRASASLATDIREGISWLWRSSLFLTLALLVAGWNFVSNAMTLVLIVRAQDLGASPALIGSMLAFYGAGGLIGSLVAPAIHARISARAVVVGATWLAAVATASLAPLRWPLALGVAIGVGAFGAPVFNVVFASYRYALVPDHLQGRVVSAVRVLAWGAVPLGTLTAGFASESFGARWSMVLLAVAMAGVATAATLVPTIRDLPPLSTSDE